MEAEELIAAIVADPEDQTAWMVYADWLLEREHPRGELIQLGPLAKAGDNEARWRIQKLEVDEDPLLSPRLAARANQWRFTFDRGFIQAAEVQTHGDRVIDAETISALCADPHARLLQNISVQVIEYRGPIDARTGLGGQRVYSRTDIGDLDREIASLRWLQRLDIHGVACPLLSHRQLRRLGIDSITGADVRIDLPALETLDWHPMAEDAGFGTWLSGAPPRLRIVFLRNSYPATIALLAEQPVAHQVESLSIRTTALGVFGELLAHAAAFPGLRQLRVDGVIDHLEQGEVDALRVALERAYPGATTQVPWKNLLPRPPRPLAPQGEVHIVDEQSRRADGTIDPISRFSRRR